MVENLSLLGNNLRRNVIRIKFRNRALAVLALPHITGMFQVTNRLRICMRGNLIVHITCLPIIKWSMHEVIMSDMCRYRLSLLTSIETLLESWYRRIKILSYRVSCLLSWLSLVRVNAITNSMHSISTKQSISANLSRLLILPRRYSWVLSTISTSSLNF